MFEYGPPTHHPLLVRSSETISEVPAKVLIRAWTGTVWWNGWKLVLLFTTLKKKSLRLQIQPVQFCNSAESYPRVYVSWTWKGGRCRGPSWGHWSRERWCVCAPCCAPALKLDFHLHTVHTRPMQSCQETAIAKHERCTFSNDGKFYLDFFFVFFTVSPMTGRNKKANNSIKWMKLYQMKYCPCQEDLTLPLPLGVS